MTISVSTVELVKPAITVSAIGVRISAPSPNPNVVASYNGGEITRDQLKAKFEGLMPCCKGRYQGIEGRKALIKDMVLPVVVAHTIKQKKIDQIGRAHV